MGGAEGQLRSERKCTVCSSVTVQLLDCDTFLREVGVEITGNRCAVFPLSGPEEVAFRELLVWLCSFL